MMHKSFKKEAFSVKQRFIERKRLLRPFLRRYGNPVLVHSINEKRTFKQVLNEGKLKLPMTHSFPKKTPYMERLLGIDNGIYYSVGFVYLTAYGWKYNLIFDLNYLKYLKYYAGSINYKCYKAIVDHWFKKDPARIEHLANTTDLCKQVVDKYRGFEYNGGKTFDFWKIEEHVFKFIQKCPHKKELLRLIRAEEKNCFIKFPNSLRNARNSYLTEQTPELVGLNENDLIQNKHFLGFYINGEIQKDVLEILRRKYPEKIIFDGRLIKRISEI